MAVDLYMLFVEQIFGGFWISVVALAALMLVFFMLGGVSIWTGLIYDLVFFLCMGIGWGASIISIGLSVAVLFYFFMELKGFMDRGAGNY
jgi:hypothetical protein